MKIVVYVLLLVNLSVFVWHFRLDDGRDKAGQNSDSGTPSLVLYKEHQARLTDRSSPEKGQVEEHGQCFSLGPFTTLDDSNEARDVLEENGIQTTIRISRDESRKGFWVFLPPFESRAEARKAIAKLKGKGVKDYFLVATGGQRNAISLGVFSQSDLAKRRRREMEKQGFKPKIDVVGLPRRQYWLDWPVAGSKLLTASVLADLVGEYSEIGQVKRDCE